MSDTTTRTKLDALIEESKKFDESKHDWTIPATSIEFDPDSSIIIPETGYGGLFNASSCPPMQPTDWAWGQAFSKLGPAVFGRGTKKSLPFDYLMAIEPDLRAELLNRHVKGLPESNSWFVRGYGYEARAILSDRYADIGNTELLETLALAIEGQDLSETKYVRSTVTPDTLHVKMVWKDTGIEDGGGGSYGVGVYVGNGEIGNNRLRFYPMIQRTSCSNSIILSEDAGISFVHRGSATTKRVAIKSVMAEVFPQAAALLEKLVAAHEIEIPRFSDVLSGLAKQYGWDDKVKYAVAAGTEAKETVAGLVNGVTYAAHKIYGENPDAMAELEILGGSLLVAKDSVFNTAARVGALIEK